MIIYPLWTRVLANPNQYPYIISVLIMTSFVSFGTKTFNFNSTQSAPLRNLGDTELNSHRPRGFPWWLFVVRGNRRRDPSFWSRTWWNWLDCNIMTIRSRNGPKVLESLLKSCQLQMVLHFYYFSADPLSETVQPFHECVLTDVMSSPKLSIAVLLKFTSSRFSLRWKNRLAHNLKDIVTYPTDILLLQLSARGLFWVLSRQATRWIQRTKGSDEHGASPPPDIILDQPTPEVLKMSGDICATSMTQPQITLDYSSLGEIWSDSFCVFFLGQIHSTLNQIPTSIQFSGLRSSSSMAPCPKGLELETSFFLEVKKKTSVGGEDSHSDIFRTSWHNLKSVYSVYLLPSISGTSKMMPSIQ